MQPASKPSYNRAIKKIGSLRLRDFATLLEACQFPQRFSELERKTGWHRNRLSRMLKTLVNLGLVRVETIPRKRRSPIKLYEITACGLEALRNLEARLKPET